MADAPTGFDDDENVRAYGGHLVAESIAKDANIHLIAAAPEMYEVLETFEREDAAIPNWLWERVEAALAKARGEAP